MLILQFSCWFYNLKSIFDVYFTALFFHAFGNNIKVCATLRGKLLHKIPNQLSFLSRKIIWLISDTILVGKSSSEFVRTVIYLFWPKFQTIRIYPFFITLFLSMSLPEFQAKFDSGTDTSEIITQQHIQHWWTFRKACALRLNLCSYNKKN